MDQIGPKMDQKGLKIALLYQEYSFLHKFFLRNTINFALAKNMAVGIRI